MAENNGREIVRWRVDGLVPHPRQLQMFGEPDPHEIGDLVDDLRRNGQLQPLEITRGGVIIAGHRRTAAARLLGWETLQVWVRDDLADDPAAVERRLIEDNLNRRQLGRLAKARLYKRLRELERGGGDGRLPGEQGQDLRDRLGERLGVSGRTLDRCRRIVERTPLEVQDAVDAGRLPLTLAGEVANLNRAQREKIGNEIRQGGDPGEVVRRHVAAAPRRGRHAYRLKDQFIRWLQRSVADLSGRVQEVNSVRRADEAALLAGQDLIGRLLRRAERLRAQRVQDATDGLTRETGPGADNTTPTPAGRTGQPVRQAWQEPPMTVAECDGTPPGLAGRTSS
jgi:ParB/RepB/Spo0J family partition protein